ncbi:hypothetical protein IW262DRAFT_1295894 [Armillaria fumosa]|nr:hypothetical protein IW262DRAFT_1295894 [Armillaria fumosa]
MDGRVQFTRVVPLVLLEVVSLNGPNPFPSAVHRHYCPNAANQRGTEKGHVRASQLGLLRPGEAGYHSNQREMENRIAEVYVPRSHLKPAAVHFTFAFITFKQLKLVALSHKTGVAPLLCSNEDRGVKVNMVDFRLSRASALAQVGLFWIGNPGSAVVLVAKMWNGHGRYMSKSAPRSRAGGPVVFSLAGRRSGDLEFDDVCDGQKKNVCATPVGHLSLVRDSADLVPLTGLIVEAAVSQRRLLYRCSSSGAPLLWFRNFSPFTTYAAWIIVLEMVNSLDVIPQELQDKIVDLCTVVDLPSLRATCTMFHLCSTIRLFEEVIMIRHRMSRSQHIPANSTVFFSQHPFLQVFLQHLIFQDGEFDVEHIELLMQMLENITDIRLENCSFIVSGRMMCRWPQTRRLLVCGCVVDSLSMQKLLLSVYRLQYLVILACTFHDVPQTIVFPSTLMSCILDLDRDLGEVREFVGQWGIRALSWCSLSFRARVPSIIEEMIAWVFSSRALLEELHICTQSRGAHWHAVVPLVGCDKLRGLRISCAERNVDTMMATLTTLPEVRLESLCLNLHLVNQPTFPGDVTQVEFRVLDRVIETLFQAGRLRYVIPDKEVYLLYAEQHARCFPMLSSRHPMYTNESREIVKNT